MRLRTLFDASLADRAGETGLEHGGRTFVFGELAARADRLACELERRGLRAGDRLAIYLPNSLEWIDLYLACTSLAVIVVPVNALYKDREVRHILTDASPAAVVGELEVPGRPEDVRLWDVHDLSSAAARYDARALGAGRGAVPNGDTPALIVYTSGTTGTPKGAVLTHGNLAANTANLVTCWNITAADRLLLALPLFHVHGLGNGLHCWLASGCRLRLETRFDHAAAAGWFLDYRPTVFFGVPTMYARMAEWPEEIARTVGRNARLFVSGSAPLPPAVHEAFEARFGHRILERYGMTETLMTLGNPLDGERRAGAVGVPFPGVSVRIVSADGRQTEPGTVGELQVRGPTVFAGYWRRPDATSAAFVDGWFRTGDLAERAGDGYVTLRGRASDLIISGGFNIYPREIEELLLELPNVLEAAVVGAPDARRGEVPEAHVVIAPGTTMVDADLESWCRAHLASFKVPRRFTILPALPKNALGKVQKHLLSGRTPPSHESPATKPDAAPAGPRAVD